MNQTKKTFVTAFALFSLFFGAGNLILPPQLGFKSGEFWWLVSIGFFLSAVLIPILGIIAHARLQGTMFDFAKKLSPSFSLVYCILVYTISIALPSPRTASVTHEMAIQPLFSTPAILTSVIYFMLVFLFVMNRSKILDIIGKLLTPAIILILLLIIVLCLNTADFSFGHSSFPSPFSHGVLEGYQTFDAIGAVVVGGVIIISINLKEPDASYQLKKNRIVKAGWIAGLALLLIYAGLILSGALMHQEFEAQVGRTELLSGISKLTLGNTANIFLSILVGLACFTTAVGIVTGTADFISSRFPASKQAYGVTAIIGCLLGISIGQLNVDYIIVVALPALMFIYPVTIVLILLNTLPEHLAPALVFKWVIAVTIVFSIPDFLGSLGGSRYISSVTAWIPLSTYSLGWVLPALLTFVAANAIIKLPNRKVNS